MDINEIVSLNVGGKEYTTTIQTLCQDPNCMLSKMFSGRFAVKKDSKGNYFIDRDGTYFKYILNYLRDGYVNLPTKPLPRKQILAEAMFYQIQGLIDVLNPVINDNSTPTESAPLEESNLYFAHRDSLRSRFEAEWLEMKKKVKTSFMEQVNKDECTLSCSFPLSRNNVNIAPFVLRELQEEGLKSLGLSTNYQAGVTFTLDLSSISDLDSTEEMD